MVATQEPFIMKGNRANDFPEQLTAKLTQEARHEIEENTLDVRHLGRSHIEEPIGESIGKLRTESRSPEEIRYQLAELAE